MVECSIKMDWERQLLSLEAYRTGENLSYAERHEISSPGDIWKISLVNNITEESWQQCYKTLAHHPEAFSHYMEHQTEWGRDQMYYLGLKKSREPTPYEKEKDFWEQKNYLRFRIFYALKWKENMGIITQSSFENRKLIRSVFEKADNISFNTQQYVNHFFDNDRVSQREETARCLNHLQLTHYKEYI